MSTQSLVKEKQKHFLLKNKTILPFCAFNGGSDAWFDSGNKLIGVQILQNYLNTLPEETLHVGDQVI